MSAYYTKRMYITHGGYPGVILHARSQHPWHRLLRALAPYETSPRVVICSYCGRQERAYSEEQARDIFATHAAGHPKKDPTR